MSRKHKIGIALMVVGVLSMAVAIVLLLHNREEDRKAGESVADLVPRLMQEMAVRESESEKVVSYPMQAEEEPVMGDTGAEEVKVKIDGYDYIGVLTIPALGLDLPVMSDWDYTRLKIAPCRYVGSAETGDLVIAAHNYSRHFGMLTNLAGGEKITFTDMDGNLYRYIVVKTEILEPTAIEEMTGSGHPLSLFTCTYGGQTRVTVRCDYSKESE